MAKLGYLERKGNRSPARYEFKCNILSLSLKRLKREILDLKNGNGKINEKRKLYRNYLENNKNHREVYNIL